MFDFCLGETKQESLPVLLSFPEVLSCNCVPIFTTCVRADWYEPDGRCSVLPWKLHARIREARAHSDELFEIVRPEALYDRPIPERHRIIFYLGHLEAFDWNLLLEPLGLASFDPDFDRLFAFASIPWREVCRMMSLKTGRRWKKCGATRPIAQHAGRRAAGGHCERPRPGAPRTWPPARCRHRTSLDARRNAVLHAGTSCGSSANSAARFCRRQQLKPRVPVKVASLQE